MMVAIMRFKIIVAAATAFSLLCSQIFSNPDHHRLAQGSSPQMPPQPVPASVGSRQVWGPHPFPRAANSGLCPQCRTMTSWYRKFSTLRSKRAKLAQLGEGYWSAAPSFLTKQKAKLTDYQLGQLRAELKRWNGRRSLFLGGYTTTRRDAGFLAHETDRPLLAAEKRNPLLGLFRSREKVHKSGLSDVPGCAPVLGHGHQRFGRGVTAGMDADFHQIDAVVMEAQKRVEQGKPQLDLDNIANLRWPSTWPDEGESRTMRAKLHKLMQKVLEGDPLLIRDVYGYIITHLLARPYALGLLRIMGLKLAERKDWGLISDMGKLIIEQKDPYFSTVQLAALLNYLAYLSIKHNKGSEHIKHLMILARQTRSSQSHIEPVFAKQSSDELSWSNVPPSLGFEESRKPEKAKTGLVERRRRTGLHIRGDIFPYIADAAIRLAVANHELSKGLSLVKQLGRKSFVPHYKTMNVILQEIIRLASRPEKPPHVRGPPLLGVLNQQPSSRGYHTSAAMAPTIRLNVRPSEILRAKEGTWLSRTMEWTKAESQRISATKNNILQTVIRYLNHNNIHISTLRLLIKVSAITFQPFLPWEVAQRALHPKQLVRRLQGLLVEAACNVSINRLEARHIWLSRGMLAITRLEGMNIVPSRESFLIVLRAIISDGNMSGARALIERMTGYGYPALQSGEVAKLAKLLPCSNGLGTLSSSTGATVSSMYIRTEQLEFLVHLRQYITDLSFIGPYIVALGRLRASARIWDEWSSLKGIPLKNGVVTAFVEGFLEADDPVGALEFVKLASRDGYPLDFVRARRIVVHLSPSQRRLGLDLIIEIIRSEREWAEDEIMGVLIRHVSRQTDSLRGVPRAGLQNVGLIAKALLDVKRELLRETRETTYDTVINRLEQCLERRKATEKWDRDSHKGARERAADST